jgi:serine/threonine-protein kinase
MKGVEEATTLSAVGITKPRLAPDGRRVAVAVGGGSAPGGDLADIWIYDLARNARDRITFDRLSNFPVWAPDGKRLAFSSARTGPFDLYIKTLDGTAADQHLTTGRPINYLLAWSPDGQWLATVSVDANTRNDIWAVSVDSPATAHQLAPTPFREGAPVFSHDGRWIAYSSDRSGRSEVYMRPFPGPGEEWTVSVEGGTEPVWARKAPRLFYRQGEAMMAVEVTTTPTVTIGKPRRLFERSFKRSVGFWPNYDVTADGERLLMVKTSATGASRINVVLNWLEELNERVPTR